MLDFASAAEAKKAFLASYDDPKFFGEMKAISVEDFVSKFPDARSFFPVDAQT